MRNQHTSDPIDVLGAVYETMFEHAVVGLQKAEELSAPLLHKLIDEAKEETVKLEEVSKEEAEKLAEWLKQDLHDVTQYFSETDVELKDWLGFETYALESTALKELFNAADKTKLQLMALQNELKRRIHPHTGEVTGAGTLVCDQCGEKLHFHKAEKIPPCPKCHATSFNRGH